MLKSIITTALRNIFRNKSFSIINLVGLSVSMSLGMLIIMIIKEQMTFDNFHADSERIFRVNTRAIRLEGGSEEYASSPLPLGQVLKDDYTFAEEVVTINRNLNGNAVYGNVNVPVSGLIVDPSFFKVFNFQFENGDASTALSQPNSLVLTHEAAEQIFGIGEPLGQTIAISGYGDFTITGILKQFPGKTHFQFQILASSAAQPIWEKDGIIGSSLNNWNNYYANYTYIKVKKGHSADEVEQVLPSIVKKNYSNLKLETRDRGYDFVLQPLNSITPGRILSNNMGNGMPTLLLIFLSILAAIVLIMSVFNFTNLMIAKSLTRAKEIGVRKVIGARRLQVFFQFVSETIIFSMIALAVSYALLQFLKMGYLRLPLNKEFAMSLKEDISVYGLFVVFAVVLGMIAGLLPAGYLSAFKPLNVLKDSGNVKVFSRLKFRKILMVTQFTFSVIFVIVVLIIYRQIDFMLTANYGINEKDILNVRLQGVTFNKLANEMKTVPGVIAVGGVSHALGTSSDRASDYKKNREDKSFVMRDFVMDENYIDNIKLIFLAGKNFDPLEESGRGIHIILNESALKQFQFTDPISAVGQSVFVNDSSQLEVIGVVKDFHYRPLSVPIGPLAIRYNPNEMNYLSVRILPGQQASVKAALETIWKSVDPVHKVDYRMMEEEIDNAYRESGFEDILLIVAYITFIAVTLACLGMLGMAMYAIKTRVKEVGVRKVLGASVGNITVLLSRSFMITILIAGIIGVPVGILFGSLFLEMFAYRISISPVLIIAGMGTISGLGLLSICSQTIHAARANPVNSLRYE